MTEALLLDLFSRIVQRLDEQESRVRGIDEFDVTRGDQLYTKEEVLKILKISCNTLTKRMREYPELRPVIVAGSQRWPSTRINAHVRNQDEMVSQKGTSV